MQAFAVAVLGPQSLALAACIVFDDAVGGIEDVGSGTVVLFQADGLGPLEHLLKVEVVLDGGAHQAGRAFRAQRQALAVELVLEGVHLLLDNVRHLADAAHKQLRVLDDGRAHIAVGKAPHQIAHLRFQPLPAGGLAGKDVVHAFDGGKFVGLCHFRNLTKNTALQKEELLALVQRGFQKLLTLKVFKHSR